MIIAGNDKRKKHKDRSRHGKSFLIHTLMTAVLILSMLPQETVLAAGDTIISSEEALNPEEYGFADNAEIELQTEDITENDRLSESTDEIYEIYEGDDTDNEPEPGFEPDGIISDDSPSEPAAKTMYTGTKGIGKGHIVYFGDNSNDPNYFTKKWLVLHDKKTNMDTEGMFLLSNNTMGYRTTELQWLADSSHFDKKYPDSDARKWNEALYNGNLSTLFECTDYMDPKKYDPVFSDAEKAMIIATTKTDPAYEVKIAVGGEWIPIQLDANDKNLNGDHFFFLSAKEAMDSNYGMSTAQPDAYRKGANKSGIAARYWLRSQLYGTAAGNEQRCGIVDQSGYMKVAAKDSGMTFARPAFNMDTSKIYFSSAASGKNEDPVNDFSSLPGVANMSTLEWKLTVKDSSLTVPNVSNIVRMGNTLNFDYSGVKNNLSMIIRKSGDIVSYGVLAKGKSAGTVSIKIPVNWDTAGYTVEVFSEKLCGEYMSDYASAPRTITVPEDTVMYSVKFDANGGSGTMADILRKPGGKVTLPECTFIPPKDKVFKCWSIDGTFKSVNTVVGVNKDPLIVKAEWKAAPGTTPVKFTFSRGGYSPEKVVYEMLDGDSFTFPECPFTQADDRYYFYAWSTSYTTLGDPIQGSTYLPGKTIKVGMSDMTLYPYYREKNHKIISYHSEYFTDTQKKYEGVSAILYDRYSVNNSNWIKDGYTLTGWSTTEGGAKEYELGDTYTAEVSLDLYPVYTPYSGTFSVKFDGNYEDLHEEGFGFYEQDLRVEKNSGFELRFPMFYSPDNTTFSNWEINGKAYNAGDVITVNSDMTIKAVWNKKGNTFKIGVVSDFMYDGTPKKPEPEIYSGSTLLIKGKDYTLSWKNNTNAALKTSVKAPSIIVKGKGNYKGTATKTFTITPVDLNNYSSDPAVYTILDIPAQLNLKTNGKKQYAKPVVKLRGRKVGLGEKSQISVTYPDTGADDYKAAGYYTVRLTGNGKNYTGSYDITQIMTKSGSLAKAKIVLDRPYYYYDYGNPVYPGSVKVLSGKSELTEGTDYVLVYDNEYDAGMATVTACGIGDYSGKVSKEYWISGKPLTDKMVSINKKPVYTGSLINMDSTLGDFTVKDSSFTMVEGVDYNVTYTGNRTDAGTFTMTISGMGKYAGTVTKKITIEKKNVTDSDVFVYPLNPTVPYRKNGVKCNVCVDYGYMTLEEGKDYSVVYKNNGKCASSADPKAPCFYIVGKGNFAGSTVTAPVKFSIEKRKISDNMTIEVSNPAYTNKKGNYIPVIKLTENDSKKALVNKTDLKADHTYEIYDQETSSWKSFTSDNVDASSAPVKMRITINGSGEYTDSATIEYEVRPKSASSFVVSKIQPQDYTGTVVEPEVTVKLKDGTTLYKGVDYNLVYENNVNKGKAIVRVIGAGAYGGEKKTGFTIGGFSLDGLIF